MHNLKNIVEVESKLSIEIELLTEKTIDSILEVKKIDLTRMNYRLGRGDKCFAGNYKGKIVSYHWLQTSGSHYVQQAGEHVKVNPNEGYIYHVRVATNYRGNRINGLVYSKILTYCKKQYLKKVWVYTNLKNRNNRKGLEALGFEINHYIYSIRTGNKYHQIFKRNIE